ncbi:hypothetical protein [Luteimonas terrae]|uniref:Uncharacterized protein n=1 Tax=Luteimonas terrae TaxID=1530191 RepID=A0ABU1XVD5_9GAMM|nr:hypothetical protein [Luteimonas terrae]MDR7192723.1 hypothetical protein [Luteimonas terrae]
MDVAELERLKALLREAYETKARAERTPLPDAAKQEERIAAIDRTIEGLNARIAAAQQGLLAGIAGNARPSESAPTAPAPERPAMWVSKRI